MLAIRSTLILLALLQIGWQNPFDNLVSNGNKAYLAGDLDQAMQSYTGAQIEAPEAPEIQYNIGNVCYRQGQFEPAATAYKQAAATFDDPTMQANAYYNLGNALFRQNKHQEAIDAYKSTLRINPDDQAAKQNIEFIRRKLKEEAQQDSEDGEPSDEQQEPGEEPGEPGSGSQEQDGDSSKDQEQPADHQGSEAQEEQDQSESDQKQHQPSDEEGFDSTMPPPSAAQEAGSEDAEELSKQEAEQLLRALQNNEKNLLREISQRRGRGGAAGVAQDW